jgi:hypothetical protein
VRHMRRARRNKYISQPQLADASGSSPFEVVGSNNQTQGRSCRVRHNRPGPPHELARGHRLAVQGDEGLPDAIPHPAAPGPHCDTSSTVGLFSEWTGKTGSNGGSRVKVDASVLRTPTAEKGQPRCAYGGICTSRAALRRRPPTRRRLAPTTSNRLPIGSEAASDDRRPDGSDQRVVLRRMVAWLLRSISSNALIPRRMRCRSSSLSARSRLPVAISTIAAWWMRAARRSNSGVVWVGMAAPFALSGRSLSHRRSVVMPLMALTVAYPTVVPRGSRQTKVERVARPTVFCEHQSNAQNGHCEYRNRPLSRSGSGGRCRPQRSLFTRSLWCVNDTEGTLRLQGLCRRTRRGVRHQVRGMTKPQLVGPRPRFRSCFWSTGFEVVMGICG